MVKQGIRFYFEVFLEGYEYSCSSKYRLAIKSLNFLFFDVAFFDSQSRGVMLDFQFLIAEPRRWSAADVAAWVQWARRQLQLPSVPMESFNVDGATLASLTEEEFCQRAPQVSANTFVCFTLIKLTHRELYGWLYTKYSSCFRLFFFFVAKILPWASFLVTFPFSILNILRVMIEFACLKHFNT